MWMPVWYVPESENLGTSALVPGGSCAYD